MYKLLIFTFLSLLALTATAMPFPDLGDPSQNVLSSKELHQINDGFMQHLQQQQRIASDPLINDYLDTIGQRLAQHSDAPQQSFDFLLIDSPEINAFAGPSGIIGINSGLLQASQSESELAAVMAHEISHVTQRHLLRSIATSKHMRLPMLLTSLAAIALGTQNGNLGSGALMAGLAGFQQQMINFTRAHEKEADRIGIALLYRANYDPKGVAQFFRRLQTSSRFYYSDLPPILRTHPVTPQRIADANNRAQRWPKRHYESSLHYRLIKARARVLLSTDLERTRRYFATEYKRQPNNKGALYGYALTLLKMDKAKQASFFVKQLMKHDPEELYYQLLQADYFQALKQYAKARTVLAHAYYLYPDSYPLIIQYGKALLAAKKADKAEQLLQQAIYEEPENITYLLLLAQAQAANNKKAAAYLTQAQALLIAEEPQLAYRQLLIAKKLAKRDRHVRARITALLHQLKAKR